MRDSIFAYGQGNPGAISFLAMLDDLEHFVIITKLDVATSIRGTNIWTLYSDLCGKDMDKVIALCKNCPTELLEDACSRQDRSGKELVKEYFTSKES